MASKFEAWDVARLYEAGLDRDGAIDRPGLNFWIDQLDGGRPLQDIARAFLESQEFTDAFGAVGSLSDEEYVDQLYQNVLGRSGDPSGVAFWTAELAAGTPREQVLIDFATSPENENNTESVENILEVSDGQWYAPLADRQGTSEPEAGYISPDTPVDGTIDSVGDTDWYQIAMTGGRTYGILGLGDESGNGNLDDPEIAVFDESGTMLAEDDDGGQGEDASLSFQPPSDGQYFVAISGGTGDTGSYRLQVLDGGPPDSVPPSDATEQTIERGAPVADTIDFAGDEDWFAVELDTTGEYTFTQVGAEVDGKSEVDPLLQLYNANGLLVATDDDGAGAGFAFDSRIDFTPPEAGTYFLAANAFEGTTGGYELHVAQSEDEGFSDAAIAQGDSIDGELDFEGDSDWFRTELDEGVAYTLDVSGAGIGEQLSDPVLRLRDVTGEQVAEDDDSGPGLDPSLGFTPPDDGTYFVEVAAFDDNEGQAGYELMLSA